MLPGCGGVSQVRVEERCIRIRRDLVCGWWKRRHADPPTMCIMVVVFSRVKDAYIITKDISGVYAHQPRRYRDHESYIVRRAAAGSGEAKPFHYSD